MPVFSIRCAPPSNLAASRRPSRKPEIAEINADEITDEPDFEVEMETQHGSEIAASPDLMSGYHHESHSEVHDRCSGGTRA